MQYDIRFGNLAMLENILVGHGVDMLIERVMLYKPKNLQKFLAR